MANQKKQVAFVVYPGINLLDLTGSFSAMKELSKGGFECFTVAESWEPLRTDTALPIVPDKTFNEVPHPAWLVVMGGGITTLAAAGNDVLRNYVLQAADRAEQVIGISTGALLLAGLGLLDGRKATTHATYISLLPDLGAIRVDRRQVEDGKFITCAGGTTGYELGLRLLGKHTSEKVARQHQIRYEYDARPPFGPLERPADGRAVLSALLAAHQPELKAALQNYPDLYQKLYPTEAAAVPGPAAGKGAG